VNDKQTMHKIAVETVIRCNK